MTLHVIGAGVGRTGTYSLKLAINRLGLGPCYHMEEVLLNKEVHVPLWAEAARGHGDWAAIFKGYDSAVDWPTAGFFRELNQTYPQAKFVLTLRDVERWTDSFSNTIYKLIHSGNEAPPDMQDWLAMSLAVIARTGFPSGLDEAGLTRAFNAHNEAVKALIPPERLLVYQVKEGWEPLCAFLGVPVPDEEFPRTNDRGEFWDRVHAATA